MNAVLHVSEKDNLVTCLRPLKKARSSSSRGKNYTVQSDIPVFHKMAVAEIKRRILLQIRRSHRRCHRGHPIPATMCMSTTWKAPAVPATKSNRHKGRKPL